MTTPLSNQIIREITPLSDKDCFYIAERYKTEFTYPIHNHSEFELNFTEKAAGVRRIVGDSSEVIDDYDLANMRELRRFIRVNADDFNLPSMKVINSVLRAHTGLIRLYFDAVYQERKYGLKSTRKQAKFYKYNLVILFLQLN